MSQTQEMYDYLFKIVIIGESGVGKSNILSRYVSNKFKTDTATTIGVEFTIKTMQLTIDGKPVSVKLQLWDTAGQERYKSVTASFYRGAVGALVVYDLTRRQTFEKSVDWMQELRNQVEDVQIILVGNKQDLAQMREVQEAEGQNQADTQNVLFVETSAQSGENVEQAFEILVRKIIEKKRLETIADTTFHPELNSV